MPAPMPACAAAEFIAKLRTRDLTERLDAVYTDVPSAIERPLRRAQARSVRGRAPDTPDGW